MEWLIDSCCSVMVPNTDSGSSAAMGIYLQLGKAASRNGLVTAVSQQCEPWLIEAGKIMNDFDIVFSYVPTVFHRHRSEKKKDVMVDAHTMSVMDRWWPCEKPQQRLIHVAKLRLTLLAERAKELTLAKSHLILSTRDLWKAALRGYNTWPGSGCLSSSEYALPNFRERGISIRMKISNQGRMSNEIVVLGSGQEGIP